MNVDRDFLRLPEKVESFSDRDLFDPVIESGMVTPQELSSYAWGLMLLPLGKSRGYFEQVNDSCTRRYYLEACLSQKDAERNLYLSEYVMSAGKPVFVIDLYEFKEDSVVKLDNYGNVEEYVVDEVKIKELLNILKPIEQVAIEDRQKMRKIAKKLGTIAIRSKYYSAPHIANITLAVSTSPWLAIGNIFLGLGQAIFISARLDMEVEAKMAHLLAKDLDYSD
jgi:hypothetical protein